MTLNDIASQIAHVLNKPLDHVLKERIKASIIQERARLIKQSFDKNSPDRIYIHRYIANLQTVDIVDACELIAGCTVLRTINKIPKPIRYNSDSIFAFVGTVDGESFSYSDLGQLKFLQSLKYQKKSTWYEYRNGYVYVYLKNKLKHVAIHAAYEDYRFNNDCEIGICYNDDEEFPCTMEMVQRIKDILLRGEFRAYPLVDEEVTISTNDEQEPQLLK